MPALLELTASREEHYSAHEIHFLVRHWEEIESRGPDLAREFSLLHDAEICLCGTPWATSGEPGGSGARRPSGRTPATARLDILRAYAALPLRWRGRTRVYLMLVLGLPERAVDELRPPEFEARHRRRIALEAFLQPDRAGESATPERSVWVEMARFLHPECFCFPAAVAA